MAEQKKHEPEKEVRIKWGSPDDSPAYYANHMSVSFAGGTEFHITFGHLSPPFAGMAENEIPNELTIKPLMTIVTSPDVMRAFVQVLNGSLESFDKMVAEREKK